MSLNGSGPRFADVLLRFLVTACALYGIFWLISGFSMVIPMAASVAIGLFVAWQASSRRPRGPRPGRRRSV